MYARLLLVGIGDRQEVPLVTHDSDEPHAVQGGCPPSETQRVLTGLNAGAAEPDVDLDHGSHAGSSLGERGGNRKELVGVVDGHNRICGSAQLEQARQLAGSDDEVSDQKIASPRGRHHLRLAELRAGQPAGAGGDLSGADPARAVAFDVRPPGDVCCSARRRDTTHVLLHHVQVEAERGRVEIVRAAPRRRCAAPEPAR